jgi:hypothetical protein
MGDVGVRGAHLVGSMPLSDRDEVFTMAATILGDHLRRLPDGETGVRTRWTGWTFPIAYEPNPNLEIVPPRDDDYTAWPLAKLSPGREDALEFPSIGFEREALASYVRFAELKEQGVVPQHVRFQVCIATPVASMILLVDPDSRAAVERAYERDLLAEIGRIADQVPHDELAFQFDVCQEVGIWEGFYEGYYDDPKRGSVDRLVRYADAVPADVSLGYHLCYGDYQHRHFMEPEDASVLRDMANAIAGGIQRPLNFLHIPVPRNRTDGDYFEPLRTMHLPEETELYLGLVHFTDGVQGTRNRIEVARAYVDRDFGVGTECGFGRRPPETIAELMRVHAEVAARVVEAAA